MTRSCRFKIGDLVYKTRNIQNPAKVIEINHTKSEKGLSKFMITFKNKKGEVKTLWEVYLKSYDKAIKDHKRKYEKFSKEALELDKVCF